jgi:hypothetical protein
MTPEDTMALTVDGRYPHDATRLYAGAQRHRYSRWVPAAAGAAMGAVVGLLAGSAVLAALLAAHLST